MPASALISGFRPGYVATDMTGPTKPSVPRHVQTQPAGRPAARAPVETVLRLPNNASASELPVHRQFEPMLYTN